MLLSNRNFDTKQESFFTKWLEQYFFSKHFTSYNIVSDKEMQVSGIDVIGDDINYDIKAQTNKKYLNNPTDTFSVEISFINRGGWESIGWFINPDLKTNHYLFVWIPECSHIDGDINDVYKVEILDVDKEKLVSLVKERLADVGDIQDIAHNLRESGERNCWINNLKLVCSNQLYEQPVNIILKKSFLEMASTGHWYVTKDEIQEIFSQNY